MAFHIVVIDDDSALQELYSLLLEGAGYKVTILSPFDLSAIAIAALHPDLIILDVLIDRKKSAWSLLQALTGTSQTAIVPILIITAFTAIVTEGKWKEILQKQSISVMLKPFDIDALLATICSLLPAVSAELYNSSVD